MSNFRTLIENLVTEWHQHWSATPLDLRGVETAASIAAYVAGEYVFGSEHSERLNEVDLEKLRAQVGYPAQWSRLHAQAALVGVIFPVGWKAVQA